MVSLSPFTFCPLPLDKHAADASGHFLGIAAILGDDQESVVSGDGADDLSPTFSVQRGGDWLSGAGSRTNYEQVLCFLHVENEFAHETNGGREGGFRGLLAFLWSVTIRGLDEAELVDITRESGLRDFESSAREGATKLVLVAIRLLLHEF